MEALAIIGPTACGKTAAALRLAENFPIEIISMDSALIYRTMDIGTAKPSLQERNRVRHHLIDIINPDEHYSAAQFVNDTEQLIAQIHARKHLPVIVGGTMMYYHALTQGLNDLPKADEAFRVSLKIDKQMNGLSSLYQRLCDLDPQTAERICSNDSQRIERALEIIHLTGKPMSAQLRRPGGNQKIRSVILCPENRTVLHQRIQHRLECMFETGFLDEVKSLRQNYPHLTSETPSVRCVGYRQVWGYLEGEYSYAEMFDKACAATRQLAKRQITWLRQTPSVCTFDPDCSNFLVEINAIAESILKNNH